MTKKIINEMHKDELELMNLLKLYVGMETLIHCIDGLDKDDKHYGILYDYLLARMHDLNDMAEESKLTIL